MSSWTNDFGQPIGFPVPDWTPRELPPRTAMTGRYCRVEPVSVERHAADLYAAYSEAPDGRDWTYLPTELPADLATYRDFLTRAAADRDRLHHAIIDLATGRAVGTAALMRADPANGAIEVGYITYSPLLQRTRVGTEAMFLMMRRVFDELGYRRYEWKCDSLNAASRAAAERLRLPLRGRVPPGRRLQGPQPRHRVAVDHRHRVAGGARGVRAMAGRRRILTRMGGSGRWLAEIRGTMLGGAQRFRRRRTSWVRRMPGRAAGRWRITVPSRCGRATAECAAAVPPFALGLPRGTRRPHHCRGTRFNDG